MKTIKQRLIEFINAIEKDINKDKFCKITFTIKNGKVIRYEKTCSVDIDKLKIMKLFEIYCLTPLKHYVILLLIAIISNKKGL